MTTERIAARRAATREAILEAAWELAHESGLGQIGMRELAGKLGMAASSLYEYFSGKDAIYDAMFVQGNEALRAEYRYLEAKTDLSPREALVGTAQRFIQFCDADHARFQLLFQHSIPGWHPSPEAYAVAVANLEEMRSYMTRIGIEDNESADLWTALTSGLASQQVANDPGGDRWLRLVEDAVDMFLRSRGEKK
jgi:AcrR family transcriptional regulator